VLLEHIALLIPIIKLLHTLHLVVITDPGIKVDGTYKPYTDGISRGVFVKVSSPDK